mgnify:CR=1 FL=1
MYIWPYFARTPFDRLTPEQRVELFQLVTAGGAGASGRRAAPLAKRRRVSSVFIWGVMMRIQIEATVLGDDACAKCGP